MKKYLTAQEYFEDDHLRLEILQDIREVLLSCELEETIKWFLPTYLHQNRIVIGLGHFNQFVGVWFHHGVFLSDPLNVLHNAQKGKTMGLRQWRFSEPSEVNKAALKSYVMEAIRNSEAGLEIKAKPKPELPIPRLLQEALDANPLIASSFKNFTNRQRNEYKEYIIDAKRQQTKINRLEKILPMILKNEGLNDKYKK